MIKILNNKAACISLLVFLFHAGLHAEPALYTVSGSAEYSASSTMTDWKGKNDSVKGTLSMESPGGKICIQMPEWNSGNLKRDAHGSEMFEVKKFLQSCFVIQAVSEKDGKTTISGMLTLHGITKAVSFTGTKKASGSEVDLEMNTVVSLSEFGMKPPVLMGIRVNNSVKVFVKAKGRR